MKEFEGKLCVVTGAARGIGKAVAVKFAEKGAGVAMLDINRELLAVSAGEVAERYGVKTWPVYVDASSTDSINQAMDQVLEAAGTPDVLANCAGISTSRKLLDVEDGEWDRVMNINLRSMFTLSKRFARAAQEAGKRGGHIVSISSQASKLGEYGNGVYSIICPSPPPLRSCPTPSAGTPWTLIGPPVLWRLITWNSRSGSTRPGKAGWTAPPPGMAMPVR